MALLGKKSWEKKIFNSHWLFTVYLALVSLVAVIVMSVNLGILVTWLWKHFIISDEEYLLSNRVWEIEQCSEPRRLVDQETVERTPEEISECEERATNRALAQRSINLKEWVISSFAWFAIFGLLFLFHYPKFLKVREES